MTIKQFVKIAGRTSEFERRGAEAIPGTYKTRTYCGNPLIYSKESDLKRITDYQNYMKIIVLYKFLAKVINERIQKI